MDKCQQLKVLESVRSAQGQPGQRWDHILEGNYQFIHLCFDFFDNILCCFILSFFNRWGEKVSAVIWFFPIIYSAFTLNCIRWSTHEVTFFGILLMLDSCLYWWLVESVVCDLWLWNVLDNSGTPRTTHTATCI